MVRTIKQLKRTFVLYCEGDSEFNYFNAIRQIPNLDIILKPINLHGGGYKNFLNIIKKDSRLNRLATFIIIDGDRAQNIFEESSALKELIEYCKRQNKKRLLAPFFLIINYPNW